MYGGQINCFSFFGNWKVIEALNNTISCMFRNQLSTSNRGVDIYLYVYMGAMHLYLYCSLHASLICTYISWYWNEKILFVKLLI